MCGYRQALYKAAVADHGWDHWFLVLHGDEIWTAHPDDIVGDGRDGYWFLLPFYFPRAGDPWQDDVHPLDQLRWRLGPGFPEFRIFRGGPHVRYEETQSFNTKPTGIVGDGRCDAPILHYLYRSPDVQRERASRERQLDIDNYRHIIDRDEVYWTDDMIGRYMAQPHFAMLSCDQVAA